MGLRGPPPTPNKTLENRGSNRANRNPDEPRPDPRRPQPPKWLCKRAKRVFRDLSRQLHAMGVLGYCDALVLGRYCDTFIQWREARDFLRKHGATYLQLGQPGTLDDEGEPLTGNGFVEGRPILGVKSYPQVKRSESLDRALIRFEDRLGLSPSARTRLRVSAGAAAPKPTEGGDDGGQTAKGKYFKISDARTG